MKKNFRKIISLLCTVALLASSLTVILSGGVLVSAADTTYYSGVYGTNGKYVSFVQSVELDGETFNNIYKVVVDDEPAKPGRQSLGFANAGNDGYYEMENGNTYTLSCEVYIKSCTGAGIADMNLYYGKTASTEGKIALGNNSKNVATLQPIDLTKTGVWQTKEVRFTYDVASIKAEAGKTQDDYKHVFLTFHPNSGASCEVYIKNLTIRKTNILVTYYDNGRKYVDYQSDGDTITRVGQNAINGERFIGWYSMPDFTGELVDKIPQPNDGDGNNVCLFARYPSTVIDFNYIPEVSDFPYVYRDTDAGKNSYIRKSDLGTLPDGVSKDSVARIRMQNTNKGVMIPAYDYSEYGTSVDKYYYFRIDPEKEYHVSIDYMNATNGTDIYFIPGTGFNNTGEENGYWIDFDHKIYSPKTEKDVEAKLSFDITGDNYKIINHDDCTTAGIAMTAKGAEGITVDKIVITEYSDATASYFPSHVTLKNNDDLYQEFDVDNGKVESLPVLSDPEDKMIFVGWYSSSYDPTKAMTAYDETNGVSLLNDFAPKACIVGDGEDYELKAMWAKREIDIDFSSNSSFYSTSVYSELFEPKHETNTYASENIDYKDGKIVFNQSSEDGYRIDLFTDEGTPVNVFENVEYIVTLEYEITGTDKPAKIGLGRDEYENANNCGFTGSTSNKCNENEFFVKQATAATTGKTSATINVTARNIHDYYLSGKAGRNKVKNIMSICPQLGAGILYSVTVEAVRYNPQICVTNAGEVELDYENKKVKITAKNGYDLKYGSLKIYNIINASTGAKTETPIKEVYCNNSGYYDLTKVLADNGLDLEHAVITAETVSSNGTSDNVAPAGRGVRKKKDGVTAGIRFKARLSDATIDRYNDLYFAIVPEIVLDKLDKADMKELLDDPNCAYLAVIGYAKKDKGDTLIYDVMMGGKGYDIQCILTGIDSFLDAPMYFALIGKKDGVITELTHDVFSYSNYNS